MSSIFSDYVAPSIGSVFAVILYGSLIPAILRIDKSGILGLLNPIPVVLVSVNAFSWVGYGLVLQDEFIYIPNCIGGLTGLFYVTVIFRCTDIPRPLLQRMRVLFVGGFTVVFALILVAQVILDFNKYYDLRKALLGYLGVVMFVIFVIAPLLSIRKVIKERDSSYLYLPLAVATVVNCLMWTIYGIVSIDDYFVYLPNGFGVINGSIQIICCLIFPRKAVKELTNDNKEVMLEVPK